MTPNPIRKVLSTLRTHEVRFLLMGGQACVFYGAAEFSRDADIVLLADDRNLERLAFALRELDADRLAVPPFSIDYLARGHAVRFRCRHPDARGIRIDAMSVLRGVAPFPALWDRRTVARTESGEEYTLLSLADLVLAKKTQRDKDWPMIRRLVEAHYAEHRAAPSPAQVDFWLREARTPLLLFEIAKRHSDHLATAIRQRPLLEHAEAANIERLSDALDEEQKREREADRAYWAPLVAELEQLRHRR